MIDAGYSVYENRGYVSWQGYNIFLDPAHKWMHECIWDWTWEWYPELMTSPVWPHVSNKGDL